MLSETASPDSSGKSLSVGKKIILSMFVTLDGFFEGPNKEIDWFVWDEEMEKYSLDLAMTIDTILFGRVTYEMMASYWPDTKETPAIADYMNNTQKIVFSKTLKKAEWKNTRLVKEDVSEEINKLKQQPGKNIVIYGSSGLTVSLTKLGLIDEYHVIINPVVLCKGKSWFDGLSERFRLELIDTKIFKSGNILARYQPAGAA